MKQAITLVIVGILLGGGLVWLKTRGGGAATAADKPAEAAPEESEGAKVSHDTNGNVVVSISDETQGDIGIEVANPDAGQWSPELKGYGRAMDPAPLAALATELAADVAAYAASSNELARAKTLVAQGNASTRTLQADEAAAMKDKVAMQSVRDRLVLGYGKAVADQNDLTAFSEPLTSQEAILVRIDLAAGDVLTATPLGARIVPLSGAETEATFLGAAAAVDPQMQGRGFMFEVRPNATHLLPGQALTGYLKLPGDPVSGAIIRRNAIVRTEGAGWVYVMNEGGESFTRTQVALDRPTDAGWFVTKGVTVADHLVVTGAQTLLSQELKSSLKAD